MATNVEVEKNTNESSANVIRRFTKRVQSAGIVPKVRRWSLPLTYQESQRATRTSKLKKLVKREEYERLLKLGKVQEVRHRRR
jgi:hypothetical protein